MFIDKYLKSFDWLWTQDADLPVFLSDHPPKNKSVLLNYKLCASITANNTEGG